MDAYLRVSRVGERDARGDAYKSPEIQREAIAQWAQLNQIELGRVIKDEDVSGSTAVENRRLEQLIRRAEDGKSDGVLVYRIDRFGRDAVEVLLALKRLTEAGSRLVAVQEGIDSSTDAGRFMIGIMVQLAEYHLAMLKTGWRKAVERAVGEGKHISSRAPLGYLRRDELAPGAHAEGARNARLVPDPKIASAVTEAFRLRAGGRSHAEIVEYLRGAIGRAPAKSTVTALLRNRVYLGEARGPGGAINADAHEPLVTPDVFQQVQRRAGSRPPRTGSVSAQALLGGVIRCAACNHKLRVMGSAAGGASYVCAARYAGGDCEAPAAARVQAVDEFVVARMGQAWEDIAEGAASAEQRFIEARTLLEAAEAALDRWVAMDAKTQLRLGTRFEEGLLARQDEVDKARRAVWDLEDTVGELPLVEVGGKTRLYEQWGANRERDKAHLRTHIGEITLKKADPARRRWQPIGERLDIKWVGQN